MAEDRVCLGVMVGAHGVRGLVNLFGIESPGLTASLALADDAAAQLSA
jgi:L-2-hydroxyglutarate oxidase LhgO